VISALRHYLEKTFWVVSVAGWESDRWVGTNNTKGGDEMLTDTKETQEFIRIGSSFGHWEKDEFLNYIWSTEFAEWDRIASTEEATKRANEAQERAERVWNEYYAR